jgi:hypothetical protein
METGGRAPGAIKPQLLSLITSRAGQSWRRVRRPLSADYGRLLAGGNGRSTDARTPRDMALLDEFVRDAL